MRRLSRCGGPYVISVAHDHGRAHQNQKRQGDQPLCSLAGALPLMQCNAPESTENHDARHMESPTGELEPPHLCFAHGVKEELHVPRCAGKR